MVRRVTSRNNLLIDTTEFIGLGAEKYSPVWHDLSRRFPPVATLLELGAGAGMTGLELLSDGFCQQLCLADIVPDCVEQCAANIRLNHLEHYATTRLSDVWDDFAVDEQFDFVIFSIPTYTSLPENFDKRCNPLRWLNVDHRIHRKLFAGAHHIRPGGHLVIIDRPTRSYPDAYPADLPLIDQVKISERDFLIFRRQDPI